MSHFAAIGPMDIWPLAYASYRNRGQFTANTMRQKHPGSPHHDTETIFLRGPKDPSPENWLDDGVHIDYAALSRKEWIAARNALLAIRRRVTLPNQDPPVMGKAMIVKLKPGGVIDWHTDEGGYAERHNRFHLPIVTNPGCNLYSANEVIHMPAGQLTFFDNHVKHSGVNMGASPRVHLIVDFRKPDAA